ncbi:YciI family protein [Microcella flavibacter]|uniref:YciI family protein n=1 Tax=Microcella flavibacter TaxID=1804990 RepID=UPI0014565FA5|nr:YciI family protein [Microcella flavibacter]
MRLMISVIDSRANSGTPDEMVAIDAFNDRLTDAGHWVLAGGLAAPDRSVVIDGAAGSEHAGPLVEAPEWVSGFWVIDAPDRPAAVELAHAGSRACGRRVELREFL